MATRKRSGTRRNPRPSRAKSGTRPLSDAMLEEAILYLLQVAVEWTGRSKATDVPGKWEPAEKLKTAELLTRVANDLLNHRDLRIALALPIRVGVLVKSFRREFAELGDRQVDQDTRARLAGELHLASQTYSVELTAEQAREIIAGALAVRPRSRERAFRERLLEVLRIKGSRDTIDDFTAVLSGSAPRRPKGAIKTQQQAMDLHSDVPAHPVDILPYVQDLLTRADRLLPGSLKAK